MPAATLKILIASIVLIAAASGLSALEPSPVKVERIHGNISGEVHASSHFSLPAGSTIIDALALAGGPSKIKPTIKIKIVHQSTNNQDITLLDLAKVLEGEEERPLLRDGDNIYVIEIPE